MSLALGAIDGAIYSAVQFWLLSSYYNWVARGDAAQAVHFGQSPVQMTNNVNEQMVTIWFVLLFAISSWLAHRYYVRLIRYPILFWQAVGITAVVGWNVIFLVLLWIEKELTGQTLSYQRITSPSDPLSGPISIALVILTNLVYGVVLQLIFRNRRAIDRPGQHA